MFSATDSTCQIYKSTPVARIVVLSCLVLSLHPLSPEISLHTHLTHNPPRQNHITDSTKHGVGYVRASFRQTPHTAAANQPTSPDDEDSDSSAAPAPVARKGKFDDEEEEEVYIHTHAPRTRAHTHPQTHRPTQVLDSWDAAEDSEVERTKAAKAAEAKAAADAEAKANHKSRAQRIEEKRTANMRRRQEDEDASSSESETESERRDRLRREQKQADLAHAEDLFGGAGGVPATRGPAVVTVTTDAGNPAATVELGSLPLFHPTSREQFVALRETLGPLVGAQAKKAHYVAFLAEFVKTLARDLGSEQVKKIASGLTTLGNEKMKEEKAAEKGGKKTKAVKTKSTLNAGRDVAVRADTTSYDDGLDE